MPHGIVSRPQSLLKVQRLDEWDHTGPTSWALHAPFVAKLDGAELGKDLQAEFRREVSHPPAYPRV